MTKRVIIVRHSQSTANTGVAVEDFDTVGLSELGHRQSEWLAESLPWEPDLVVHSRLPRTIETARPILERYPHVSAEEWPIHEFMPVPASRIRGSSLADTADQWAAYWDRCDPYHAEADGGETFAMLCDRVEDCFVRIAAHSAQAIVIISHGRFIRVARAALDLGGFHDLPGVMRRSSEIANIPNAAIMEFSLAPDGRPESCRMLRQDSPRS